MIKLLNDLKWRFINDLSSKESSEKWNPYNAVFKHFGNLVCILEDKTFWSIEFLFSPEIPKAPAFREFYFTQDDYMSKFNQNILPIQYLS